MTSTYKKINEALDALDKGHNPSDGVIYSGERLEWFARCVIDHSETLRKCLEKCKGE